MLSKKWLSAVLSCLVVTAVLSACSSDKEKPAAATGSAGGDKASAKPIELSIWSGWSDMDPWFKKMADEYKKTHPNVTITLSSFPLRDYEKKVAVALPSKSAADILPLNPDAAERYVGANLLQAAPVELSKQVDSGIYPKLLSDTTKANGKTFGVPFMMGASAIFYNKDMLKEAGLTDPPNVDNFLEYAQKLAKKDANGNLQHAGMSLRLSGGGSGVAEKFWILLAQRGGSILKEVSPGKYKANYNSEEGYQTLKMYVDMVHKYKTDDPKVKHDTEAFQQGLAAFYVRESNVIADTKAKAPNLNYSTVPLKANVISLINFNVAATDKAKAEASWDFIKFLTQPENQKQMMAMSGWLTPRSDMDMSDLYKDYPQYQGFFAKQDLYVYPNLGEIDEIFTKLADRLATKGYTDPSFVDNPDKMKAFLNDAAKETDDILKKAGHLAE